MEKIDIKAKLKRRAQFLIDFLKNRNIMPPESVITPVAESYAKIISLFIGDSGIYKTKGFFLFGPTGCGKTTLVSAIRDCCRLHTRKLKKQNGFVFLRARRLCEDYSANESFLTELREISDKKAVIIDDLGTERTACRYGNQWGLEDFIEDRYDTWEDLGLPTIFTSNLQKPDSVLQRYGERAMSRLIGMVDFISYNYYDRRLQQTEYIK